MRLLDARIKNFKGIENWQIEFKPGFNLIKGTNGKGKTSILEAVAVGLGSFLSGVPDIKARHITKDEMRRVFYIIGDGSYGCRYEIPVEIEFNAILNDEPIHWQRSKNSIQAAKSTTQPSDIKRLAEKMSNTQDIELPLLNYQGAARIWSQKKEKADNFFRGHYFRTVGYTDTLDEASNIKLLLNWCLKMEQIAWQKNRPISEYETVKRAVSKFMSLLEPDKEYTFFYDRQQDSLLCQENDKVLKIADMSAGYQSLIWMVLDIAFRMAVLNPFKLYAIPETCGIVLIDELDMHLHPKWQWRVIDALRGTFPNIQFIAATHSPILFASAKNVWLIDIDSNSIHYSTSHYGIDLNTSVSEYQQTNYLPSDLEILQGEITKALDDRDYALAAEKLRQAENIADPHSPFITSLRTRLELELSWENE